MSNPDKCPHCEASVLDRVWESYACGTMIESGQRSSLCVERAARIKTETELAATKRELDSVKGLHQQCLDSVTMICVTFPNADEYVRQLDKQRDAALARVAELEAAIELARVGH